MSPITPAFNKNKPIKLRFLIFSSICLLLFCTFTLAFSQPNIDIDLPISSTEKTINHLKNHNISDAKIQFQAEKKWWRQNKQSIKKHDLNLALEIDTQIANITLLLLSKDYVATENSAVQLLILLHQYKDSLDNNNQTLKNTPLEAYIAQLNVTKQMIESQDSLAIQIQISKLQQQWLAVEGYVVSLSTTVYDEVENDLMRLAAYQNNNAQYALLLPLIERMIVYLTPLKEAHYTWFDAALIPFREGLEALLIISALLSASKKSQHHFAKRWILIGSGLGGLISLIIGGIVVSLFSIANFGQNNQMINGYAGVFSSIMMVYICYYLHQSAHVQARTQSLYSELKTANTRGKAFYFALLAFLALIREGLETVIFLIGMAGTLSIFELSIGVGVGFASLGILAFLLLYIGVKLPLKPFFHLSSCVVFYLCFKFMGSGIHSLQLAGIIPSHVNANLPTILALNIYPSWYSSLPQLILIIAALYVILRSYFPSHAHYPLETP